MILPEIKPIDVSQPMQNFLVAKRQKTIDSIAEREALAKQEALQREIEASRAKGLMDRQKFENDQTTFKNSLADRDTDLVNKAKDREYNSWKQKAAQDEVWQQRGQELLSTIDTEEKDDTKYNAQVSAVADQMGARLAELGAPAEYIQKMVQDVFKNGGFSRSYIRGVKKKLGVYVEPSKPKTETIQVGDQNVTYEVDSAGNRTEIARGPKWDAKSGKGTTEASMKAEAWGRIYKNKAVPADLAITGLDRDPALAQAAKMVSDDMKMLDATVDQKIAKTREIADQIRGNYGQQFMDKSGAPQDPGMMSSHSPTGGQPPAQSAPATQQPAVASNMTPPPEAIRYLLENYKAQPSLKDAFIQMYGAEQLPAGL